MGFLNNALNKQVTENAIDKGYVRSTFEINEVYTKLSDEDWKEFIVEGQIVEIVKYGDRMDVVGRNEMGSRITIGRLLDTEDNFKHGVILYPTLKRNRLSIIQPIILHEDENPETDKINPLKLRDRSGKTSLEKTASELGGLGKSFMPLTFIIIIILVLLYMCL